MPGGREEFFQKIRHGKGNGGCVHARVTAQHGHFFHVFIHHQRHILGRGKHKAHRADGTGGDMQIFFHFFRRSKGQPGNAQQFGKHFGFEGFVAGQKQQIKAGLLAVAQEKIFAHFHVQDCIGGQAILHGMHRRMVHPGEGDGALIQKIIYRLFVIGPLIQRGPCFQLQHGSFLLYRRKV